MRVHMALHHDDAILQGGRKHANYTKKGEKECGEGGKGA